MDRHAAFPYPAQQSWRCVHHAKYLPQRRTMMQAWADYLDSLRARGELDVSHQAGQQAAATAVDAFQYVESEGTLSFQAQAMEASGVPGCAADGAWMIALLACCRRGVWSICMTPPGKQ